MLEFATVNNQLLKSIYDAYSFNIIPRVGAAIAGDRAAYQYLVESIRKFPDQRQVINMLQQQRFINCNYIDYSFGIASCYSAFKPVLS